MQNIKIFDEVLVSFFHFSSILVLTIFGRFWTSPQIFYPGATVHAGKIELFFCTYVLILSLY